MLEALNTFVSIIHPSVLTWTAEHHRQGGEAGGQLLSRVLGSLCYPTMAPRFPSGTLVNKMKSQSQRAILLGYSGGRSGAGESIGFAHSQPSYICYLPESNSTVFTNDGRICYDPPQKKKIRTL